MYVPDFFSKLFKHQKLRSKFSSTLPRVLCIGIKNVRVHCYYASFLRTKFMSQLHATLHWETSTAIYHLGCSVNPINNENGWSSFTRAGKLTLCYSFRLDRLHNTADALGRETYPQTWGRSSLKTEQRHKLSAAWVLFVSSSWIYFSLRKTSEKSQVYIINERFNTRRFRAIMAP